MTIRRFRSEEPVGCVVDLYGSDSLLTLTVEAESKTISLDLYATLESPESSRVVEVQDCEEGWRAIRHMMRTVLGGNE